METCLNLLHLKLKLTVYFATDADSTCDHSLALDPPEVIGEYEQTEMVNCTFSDEFHDGLYWEIQNTKMEYEEERSFVELQLELSNWNLKAECKIKQNDSFECSKDLKITVYSK